MIFWRDTRFCDTADHSSHHFIYFCSDYLWKKFSWSWVHILVPLRILTPGWWKYKLCDMISFFRFDFSPDFELVDWHIASKTLSNPNPNIQVAWGEITWRTGTPPGSDKARLDTKDDSICLTFALPWSILWCCGLPLSLSTWRWPSLVQPHPGICKIFQVSPTFASLSVSHSPLGSSQSHEVCGWSVWNRF